MVFRWIFYPIRTCFLLPVQPALMVYKHCYYLFVSLLARYVRCSMYYFSPVCTGLLSCRVPYRSQSIYNFHWGHHLHWVAVVDLFRLYLYLGWWEEVVLWAPLRCCCMVMFLSDWRCWEYLWFLVTLFLVLLVKALVLLRYTPLNAIY